MVMTFYLDLLKGCDPAMAVQKATTSPGLKHRNSMRVAFDVSIPDHLWSQTDEKLDNVPRAEIAE